VGISDAQRQAITDLIALAVMSRDNSEAFTVNDGGNMKAKLIAAGLFILGIIAAAFKLVGLGRKAEKADNLEAHLEGGKQQRAAEKDSDDELQETIDEIKSTRSKRGRFTR
jgi:hypothetical protein